MERSKNLMYYSLAICALCVALLALIYSFAKIQTAKQSSSFITVEGSGFVDAKPDTAIINIIIRSENKEVSKAQDVVKNKAEKLLTALDDLDVEEKDIKTENYSSFPKYDYPQNPVCLKSPCPPPLKPILLGYEVRQMIVVKLRDLQKVGELLKTLGKLEITEFSTPNFVVDDMTKLQEIARKNAIEDAKSKAKRLAKDLDVKLVGISSFSENNFQPRPFMMMKTANVEALDVSSNGGITAGQNRISVNVNITYEIK